jgi:hypothetical protein
MKAHATLTYPRSWKHGLASLKGDHVVMSNPKIYEPLACGNLFSDFTAIQKPSDVVDFVNRYGLLYHEEGSEKVIDFLQEASAIRLLANIIIYIRSDDVESLSDVWAISEFSSLFEAPASTGQELLNQASILVSWVVNEKLQGLPHGLVSEANIEVNGVPGNPGSFLWVVFPENLLQYIYYQFATTINKSAPIANCLECHRIFIPEHGRQQYCSQRCANRARVKRYRSKENS